MRAGGFGLSDIFQHLWPEYDPGRFFCELTTPRADAGPVPQWLAERLQGIGLEALRARALSLIHI